MKAALASARFKARRRIDRRLGDPELRQMRSLIRSYSRANGPEVLVFGDSAMFRTQVNESDKRHLADLILAELGGKRRAELLVGPGYQPRIVLAFLDALSRCQHRPSVIVVPTSLLMAATLWYLHPHYCYVRESRGLAAAANGEPTRRLERSGPDDFDRYDRLPAPSLFGARRTAGELRLIVNSKPESSWQHAVRMRHILDYYFAEELTEDKPGVKAISELGVALSRLGLPVVAYVAPCNYELAKQALGEHVVPHIEKNSMVIEKTVAASFPPDTAVVNAALSCPGNAFADAAHLNETGRMVIAKSIAEAIRQYT